MTFINAWMTHSESLVYCVIPKCGCTTIGQMMYYLDHGRIYGDGIHNIDDALKRWRNESDRELITTNIRKNTYTFTCVRNPYTRLVSAFLNKICNTHATNEYYARSIGLVSLREKYGIDIGNGGMPFDQIKSFRRFLLAARDTIRWNRPMDPDIHWAPMSVGVKNFINYGGNINRIVALEEFDKQIVEVLDNVGTKHMIDPGTFPRFNICGGVGPNRTHPIEDYYDDLSRHLMWECYRDDFELFGYDHKNPCNIKPAKEINAVEICQKLKCH